MSIEPDDINRVRDLIIGWREAAIIEQAIVDFCEPEVLRFLASRPGDGIEVSLLRVTNSNDARANRDRFTKDADALEALLAALPVQPDSEPAVVGAEGDHASAETREDQ